MDKERLQKLAGVVIRENPLLKGIKGLNEAYESAGFGLSSPEQDKRLGLLYSQSDDNSFKLLYHWVNTSAINVDEFAELIKWYMKE